MIAIRSHKRSAWAMTWVEKITVAPFAASAADQRFELLLVDRVEAGERLVEHDQPRLVDHACRAIGRSAPCPWTGCGSASSPNRRARVRASSTSARRRPSASGSPRSAPMKAIASRAVHRRIEAAFLGQIADLAGRHRAGGRGRAGCGCPLSGSMIPSSIRRVVVLPAPLGPSMPKMLPVGTVRLTPSTARLPSNVLDQPARFDRRDRRRSSVAALVMVSAPRALVVGASAWRGKP